MLMEMHKHLFQGFYRGEEPNAIKLKSRINKRFNSEKHNNYKKHRKAKNKQHTTMP